MIKINIYEIFCGKTLYSNFSEKKPVQCTINHKDGTTEEILLNHSYNDSQIEWFKAGSAMNVLRNTKHS